MTVTDEAIEKIKGMIVSGALRPGDRLPKESELAADLGLSRNSLREAVRALSLIRILDVRQGDGTYVTDLDVSQLLSRRGGTSADGNLGVTVTEATPGIDQEMAMQLGDRMLAIFGALPSDSLRAMIRRINAEMRSK